MTGTSTPVSKPPSLRPVILPLSGLLVAQFVAGLSGTIVATSIPTIMGTLHGPPSHATWLVAATILANTASTPIWGKLGDMYSAKRVLQAAVTIFLLGSILAGFTSTTSQLLVARAIQGLGLGGLFTLVAIVVATLVEARQRGRVNGWLTSIQTTATIVGPVVGGIIVQIPGLGWRWCFFLAVPFALASVLIIATTLRIERPPRIRTRPDFAGAILVGTSVAAILVWVTSFSAGGAGTVFTTAVGVYGAVGIVAAVIVELRASDPVVPLRLLASRTPVLVVVAAVCAGTTVFGGTVFIAQYLQTGLGITPLVAGMLLVPMALGSVLTSVLAGRYMSRTGRIRPVLVFGTLVLFAGNALLWQLNLAPIPLTIIGTVLIASGLGAITQNLVLAAQNAVPLAHVGAVSATVMFFFFLGGTSGLVVFGAVLTQNVAGLELSGLSNTDAVRSAVPGVFALAAGMMVPAFLAVLALPRTLLRSSI